MGIHNNKNDDNNNDNDKNNSNDDNNNSDDNNDNDHDIIYRGSEIPSWNAYARSGHVAGRPHVL